jgi:predicted polyphosphate/ATP-dependent NAD kinase
MGEIEAKEGGFNPTVIGSIQSGNTTSADTKNAAREMAQLEVGLLLFAGGDGTARDICEAIDSRVPVLGIPSGVKIHSGVFALNPDKAGDLAAKFLQEGLPVREGDVMDIDEEAFREGRVSARLYGYLRIPDGRTLVQDAKLGSSRGEDEEYQKRVIAAYVTEQMQDDYHYIIGPGSTTEPIADRLGIEKTLLGVDVVKAGKLVTKDANEKQLMQSIEGKKAKIIVTPIGGQGYIFGRGNQQISPEVIKKVGKDNIIVVATRRKLDSLTGKPLLVDTGDREVDQKLTGYMRVIVGYREEVVKKIER